VVLLIYLCESKKHEQISTKVYYIFTEDVTEKLSVQNFSCLSPLNFTSVILVQQFIFILVFIQFSVIFIQF